MTFWLPVLQTRDRSAWSKLLKSVDKEIVYYWRFRRNWRVLQWRQPDSRRRLHVYETTEFSQKSNLFDFQR
jgi:hypothetical protein